MPTPQRIIDAARKRRERVCKICGVAFLASRPTNSGLCSKKCRGVHQSRSRTGWKQTEETKAKRNASLAAFRAAHPEAEDARKAAARAACQTPEYITGAFDRYAAMLANGTGICSDEVRQYTATRAKWLMKAAREELECNTEFVELWRDTLARLRREMPYDGPLGTADYFDYCRKIGMAITADPAIRAVQDNHFKEAIPRLGRVWDDAQENKVGVTKVGAKQ